MVVIESGKRDIREMYRMYYRIAAKSKENKLMGIGVVSRVGTKVQLDMVVRDIEFKKVEEFVWRLRQD